MKKIIYALFLLASSADWSDAKVLKSTYYGNYDVDVSSLCRGIRKNTGLSLMAENSTDTVNGHIVMLMFEDRIEAEITLYEKAVQRTKSNPVAFAVSQKANTFSMNDVKVVLDKFIRGWR